MANICVIGIGRIGLALALVCAKKGHSVIGLDKSESRLSDVRENNFRAPERRLERELLRKHLKKNLFVSEDLQIALSKSTIVFVTVGTSVRANETADLTNLFYLVNNICRKAENVKGKLFIFKSTLPIGTTRKIVRMIEEKTGLECGKDFYLVFSPERVLGDKAIVEMQSVPKIIGGIDKVSAEKAVDVYKTIGGKIIVLENPEAAELIKLVDNAYRQTMFAFANDVALIAERFGLDAYEIIKAANDSYPRNRVPFPSAGVSGYCLTKDPLYLETSFKDVAEKRGFPSVWYNARKTNDYMPAHVVELLEKQLTKVGSSLEGANVLVCGITYKENVDDTRSSHGLEIAKMLEEKGVNVFVWDPNVHCPNALTYKIVDDIEEVIQNIDALIFTVKHDEFMKLNENNEILRILEKMRKPVLVDGWGIFRKLKNEKHVYYTCVGVSGSAI